MIRNAKSRKAASQNRILNTPRQYHVSLKAKNRQKNEGWTDTVQPSCYNGTINLYQTEEIYKLVVLMLLQCQKEYPTKQPS